MNCGAITARLLAIGLIGVPVIISDLRTGQIPNTITLPVFVAGGVLWALTDLGTWWEMLIAVGVGILVPLVARVITGGGLGWGDIKLAPGLALVLGWPKVLSGLGLAAALALAGTLARSPRDSEAGIPFGPYLICGAFLVILAELVPGVLIQ